MYAAGGRLICIQAGARYMGPTPGSPQASYERLGAWLTAQPGPRVTLRFADIEAILGQPLPASARAGSSWWWQAERRQQAAGRAWRAAGWRLAAVDRRAGRVTYVRSEDGE